MVTAISITATNLIKWAFLSYKYKMAPYDFNSLKLLFISIVEYNFCKNNNRISNNFIKVILLICL